MLNFKVHPLHFLIMGPIQDYADESYHGELRQGSS